MRSDAVLEADILAAVLYDSRLVGPLMRLLEAEDFASERLRVVHDAILAVAKRDGNEAVTPVTVRDELRRTGAEEQQVVELMDPLLGIGTVGSFEPKCRRLRDLRRHRLIETAWPDIARAPSVDEAQVRLEAMMAESARLAAGDQHSLGEVLDELMDEKERALAEDLLIRTGLPSLDIHLGGGLAPGWLTVIGARTGVGKTTLAVQIATKALASGRVLYFSLEETRTQIAERLVRHISRVPRPRPGEFDGLFNAVLREDVRALPLVIRNDNDVDAICGAIAEHAMETEGVAMVMVDYVQLIRSRGRYDNRVAELSEITARLKTCAMQMRVPIVIGAQINRSPMTRVDKTPQLSDLKDSGSIEQDADVVFLLHPNDPHDPKVGELGLAKNRYGSPGHIPIRFDYAVGAVQELSA